MSGRIFTKVPKPASTPRRPNEPVQKRSPWMREPLKLRYKQPAYQGSIHGGASFDFTTIPLFPPNRAGIQPKLRVGESNDKYEQEADRVADTVMRTTEPKVGHASPSGNRGNPPQSQRLCRQCEEEVRPLLLGAEEQALLQKQTGLPVVKGFLRTNAGSHNTPEVTPKIAANIESLKGGGQPLSDSTRAFFEPRFSHDFSTVRVHTNARAVESAHALGARAYTVGRDVVFGSGQYAPDHREGRRLLAHELTHVVQQSGMVHKKIQRQSIHSPLYPCHETSLMPGGMDFFGTLVHLAIQQHYVSNIDPLAGTEYAIPGSSAGGFTGRADIVSSSGGVYEIKPLGLAAQGFAEAENYVLHAERNCDPLVNWHLGTVYFPPPTPLVIGDNMVVSWLEAPGVIAYTRRVRAPEPVPQPEGSRERAREREHRRQPELVPDVTPAPAVPQSTLDKIMEFAKRVIETGADAEQAAEEFFRENPEIALTILVLGTVGILLLIADDAIVAGIADDVLIPVIGVLMRVAWRFAF